MKKILSQLFREIEHDIGTRDLSLLAFNALMESIEKFEISNIQDFKQALGKIVLDVKDTEPRIAIIIDHFFEIYAHLTHIFEIKKADELTSEYVKSELRQKAEQMLKRDTEAREKLLEHATKTVNLQDKKVLIYDHSHTVQEVLRYIHNQGQNFKVTIAEQDIEKTEENIYFMDKAQIPFEVVPAYMLSHYDENIDMLFFGALTYKSNYHFVLDTGCSAIISQFHVEKKPMYMCMTTSKFALWKSDRGPEVYSHPHLRKHSKKEIMYQRLKFSHDRIAGDLFTKIITDEGVFDSEELKKLYDQKFEKHAKMRELLNNMNAPGNL